MRCDFYRYIHKTNAANIPKAQSAVEQVPPLTLDEAKERIEESFADTKAPPVHPRKPGLQPVDIMPVLPHMDRYGRSHVIASSMAEVVTHVLANGASEEQRAALYERCILRTYNAGMIITHLGTPSYVVLASFLTASSSCGADCPGVVEDYRTSQVVPKKPSRLCCHGLDLRNVHIAT